MFRAIGVVIIIYAVSIFFESSFSAFNDMVTTTFQVVEDAVAFSGTQF